MKAYSVGEVEREEQGEKACIQSWQVMYKNDSTKQLENLFAKPSQQHTIVIGIPLLSGLGHHIL